MDPSMTGQFELQMPKELLAHARRPNPSRPKGGELHVEGWKSSWLSRLVEKLIGKD